MLLQANSPGGRRGPGAVCYCVLSLFPAPPKSGGEALSSPLPVYPSPAPGVSIKSDATIIHPKRRRFIRCLSTVLYSSYFHVSPFYLYPPQAGGAGTLRGPHFLHSCPFYLSPAAGRGCCPKPGTAACPPGGPISLLFHVLDLRPRKPGVSVCSAGAIFSTLACFFFTPTSRECRFPPGAPFSPLLSVFSLPPQAGGAGLLRRPHFFMERNGGKNH